MIFHSKLEEILSQVGEELLSSYGQKNLAKAFQAISDRYRKESGSFLQTKEERWAYLFTRMPGTFSVIEKVLKEISFLSPESFLDVGAGPGTGLWATFERFPDFLKYTLLEKDHEFSAIGKKLAGYEPSFTGRTHWFLTDLTKNLSLEPHDVTLLSYSIGEIREEYWKEIFRKLWDATQKAIVIIEPGTPNGYKRILKIRDLLKEMGGFIWAPCPHAKPCPLQENDWCHFSSRVQRSSLHRNLKSADLGYEDEKFSYLIVGKEEKQIGKERIIRHPVKHSGFLEVTLCTEEGIQKKIYSKKEGELYKHIKKLNWGETVS